MDCEFDGCGEPATDLAKGRRHFSGNPGHPRVGNYCTKHADVVADEGDPEYVVDCPNCGCQFGVN
jgi:hypothetical protein